MLKPLFLAALLLSGPSLSAAAGPADDCPPVEFSDRKDSVKVGLTVSLLTKFVSNLGFSPAWEHENKSLPPQSDEFYLKAVAFGMACRQIAADKSLTFNERQAALRQWVSLAFLVPNPAPPSVPVPAPAVPQLAPASAEAIKQNVAVLIAHRPSRPLVSNAIIRVFMKSNIRERGVAALQAALPSYDVRIGNSEIDPSNSADLLFVNRSTVTKDSIIRVLEALEHQGVYIKSVQQSELLGSRKEIQVGTFLTKNGLQMFADSNSLDLAYLNSLSGNEFWKAAFNGKAICNDKKVGFGKPCYISNEGEPVH